MSPLVFLAIPLGVFIVGSTALWLASRWRQTSDLGMRRVPDELRAVAPMVRDQRQAGWQNGAGQAGVRVGTPVARGGQVPRSHLDSTRGYRG